MSGAKDLKIKSETSGLKARLCRSWGLYCVDPSADPDWDAGRREAGMRSLSNTERLVHRIEDRLVSILQVGLWGLADHGYRPERVVWYIAGSLIVFWFAIQVIVGVVGYSIVEGAETDKDPQVRPVSLLFLFDKLVPAYKIREEHSKPLNQRSSRQKL